MSESQPPEEMAPAAILPPTGPPKEMAKELAAQLVDSLNGIDQGLSEVNDAVKRIRLSTRVNRIVLALLVISVLGLGRVNYHSCMEKNKLRVVEIALWDHILDLPATTGEQTPDQLRQVEEFRGYVHNAFAPVNCWRI